jgi:hypothetical protein
MGWWSVVRPFAPWIAVVLAFAMAWQCGASRAKDKMRADVAEAEAETKLRAAERDVCTEALAAFRLDLKESNERVLARAEAFDQWADQLERLTEADRQRLAASYARNVERERAENAELRERISGMAPGEACLEMVREVADGFDP